MPLRLVLFGSPAIEHDGESLALPFERRGQLLAYLALKRGWVQRAELAALLWPEQDAKLAYANLRKALFRLQSLPRAPAIELQGNAARLEAETDVFAFESALGEGRGADAIALRRGELLAGFDDDANEAWSGWLRFERDRLRAAWRDAALSRLGAEMVPAEAIDLSARLLEADPLDEAALRAQLAWLARSGQGARARQAYREFVKRLGEELGVGPNAGLKALHDSLGATGSSPAPAQPSSSRAGDEGFVGRSVELRRIAEMLSAPDCRLVNLVGPGGVGKTRLAQHAIQDLGPAHEHGAAFVPLEDIATPEEIAGRMARVLGVGGPGDPLDRVVTHLRERDQLLVLDNFEHLAAGAPVLEHVLAACPRLRILVTSRVRLALAAEWVFPLEGLPCPEIEDRDRIEAFDAARLFIQAARRVEPDLQPAREAAAIVDICRQLEGLPLALQLAAAWTRVLSCEAIATELRQGTELLRAVDAALPARHASFDIVFDQSWRMLAALEREALSRLSVFRGGFSAEAARTVAGATLPVLGALADKSLLRKEGARMRLHPLVQQLAAVRLGDGAPHLAARSAHAAYFHNRLARLGPAVEDGDREALEAIDADFENFRLAWQFSIAHGPAEALARNVRTLLTYCELRVRLEEGLALLRQAMDSPLGTGDRALQALLLSHAAQLEYRLDRYGDAQASAERALAAERTPRKSATKRQALTVLASCAFRTGRLEEAGRLYRKCLAQAPEEDRAHVTASTLDNLALVEKRLGHYDEALRLSHESLAEHRRIGDSAGAALCMSNLGSLYLLLEDTDAAAAILQQALALCERDGLVATLVLVLANLATLAMGAGDLERARGHAERALELAEARGIRAISGWLKVLLARVAVRRGDLDAARALLSAGSGLALAIGAPFLKTAVVLGFAELVEAWGQRSGARRVLAFGMENALLGEPDRVELRREWARRPAPAEPDAAWPALSLDELLRRIESEADSAHAALLALLR